MMAMWAGQALGIDRSGEGVAGIGRRNRLEQGLHKVLCVWYRVTQSMVTYKRRSCAGLQLSTCQRLGARLHGKDLTD